MADDILKSVADEIDRAITSGDYSNLDRRISESLGKAVKMAVEGNLFDMEGSHSRGQAAAREEAKKYAAAREAAKKAADELKEKQKQEDRYFIRPEDPMGAKIMEVVGAAGAVLFGLGTVFFAVLGGGAALWAVPAFLTAAGIAMAVFGRSKAKKLTRFKAYRELLLPKLYSDVRDLAVEMNLSETAVVKDLEKYSKDGWIRQGHFDASKKCFIASDDLYQQYRTSEASDQARSKAQETEKAKQNHLSAEVKAILDQGNACIEMIRTANDNIPDPGVTAKLNRMETVVRRIFDEVREKPELAGKLNLFMTYYLPTTEKLVSAYEEMDRQGIEGENITRAKQEIASSLGTINDAFEKILDSFFLQQTEDVTSDINVMKMMMQQEGLTEDDLTALRKKQDAEMAAGNCGTREVMGGGQYAYAGAGAAEAQTEKDTE